MCPNEQVKVSLFETHIWLVVGYHLDKPILMAGPKPLQTFLGIHHNLENCVFLFQVLVKISQCGGGCRSNGSLVFFLPLPPSPFTLTFLLSISPESEIIAMTCCSVENGEKKVMGERGKL